MWAPDNTSDGLERMYSPAGDHREHTIYCKGRYSCRRRTWAYDAICDACFEFANGEQEVAS
jgi:hypothetical protein